MFLEVILGILALTLCYGFYLKNVKWRYFERKGIFQQSTSFPLGNFNNIVFQVKNIFRYLRPFFSLFAIQENIHNRRIRGLSLIFCVFLWNLACNSTKGGLFRPYSALPLIAVFLIAII